MTINETIPLWQLYTLSTNTAVFSDVMGLNYKQMAVHFIFYSRLSRKYFLCPSFTRRKEKRNNWWGSLYYYSPSLLRAVYCDLGTFEAYFVFLFVSRKVTFPTQINSTTIISKVIIAKRRTYGKQSAPLTLANGASALPKLFQNCRPAFTFEFSKLNAVTQLGTRRDEILLT